MKKIILFILLLIPGLLNAQWTQSNGPFGSTITCYAFGATYSYIGTSGGGIFRSSDGGLTWTNKSNGIMLPSAPSSESIFIHIIEVGPTNVYAGTDYGVFVSGNNGDSWVDVSNNLINNQVNDIILDGTNMYAATAAGVEVSTNNGMSWTDISIGIPGGTAVNEMTLNGTDMFAGTVYGVFHSTDNGLNWSAAGFTDTAIASIAVNGTTILASTIYGVYRSTNNGATWINTGFGGSGNDHLMVKGSDFYCSMYGGGILRSTDDGILWNPVNTGLTNPWITALANDGANLYAGSAYTNAYYSTDDGTNWMINNNGITHTDVYSLYTAGGDVYAGTLGAGVGRTTNSGTTWTSSTNGLAAFSTIGCVFVNALVQHSTKLFAGTTEGVYASTDNGASWAQSNNGFIAPVNIFSFTTNGSKIYAGTLDGVYMSTDAGANWTQIGLAGEYIYSMVTNGSDIIAGVTGGVEITNNDGVSWSFNTNGFSLFTNVNSLLVDGTDLYAGTSLSGVYRSTDAGVNWTSASTGLPTVSVNALMKSGSKLIAGLGAAGVVGGIYLSTNNGNSWTEAGFGLINFDIRALATDGILVYAATHGNGVWQEELTDITSVENIALDMFNVYPNPAADQITIHQSANNIHFTKATIINSNGEVIQSWNCSYPLTTVNVSQLSSGNYFIVLENERYRSAKTFIKGK